MLDRLISGSGAVTDGADRAVRLLASGSRSGFATTRPGSVPVAALLLVLAGILALAGLEATDPPTPLQLAPSTFWRADTLGNRTYATMHGAIPSVWVETFEDDNGNGTQESDENGIAWYYWLVGPADRTGVTVRSTRPPAAVFRFRGSGVLVADPRYASETYPAYAEEARRLGLAIEPAIVLDTTVPRRLVDGSLLDLARPFPDAGSIVEVSGSRLGSYIAVCRGDPDGDEACDPDEEDTFEILVFDGPSGHAIRVLVNEVPEFTYEATITGQLRREERAVDDARSTVDLDLRELGLVVSDRYVLDDGSPPGSASLAFALAGLLATVAGIILIGLASGYVIYRRSDSALPAPATTMAAGERLPLRISGVIRTPTGLEHVREVPGELVRFYLGRQVVASATSGPTDPSDPPGSPEPPVPPAPPEQPESPAGATTLLVERVGHPQGVALGLGELERVSAGEVMALRGPRPAARVVAGTGPLVLSFDTATDRDRAVAELLDETGLGADGKRIETA